MTQAFTPNLVNDPIDISSDTFLPLPETLSLPSTSSRISQTPTTTFPLNFPKTLGERYKLPLTNNRPLRLDWNKFVVPHPLIWSTS